MERFLELYKAGWQKYARFDGRACRAEICAFLLTHSIILTLLGIYYFSNMIGVAMGTSSPGNGFGLLFFISLVFIVAIFIPSISITVRRLHDLDKSGWLYLVVVGLSFLPFIGAFIPLVFSIFIYFAPGTEGSNQYGPESDMY